jgi:hypothetical protein
MALTLVMLLIYGRRTYSGVQFGQTVFSQFRKQTGTILIAKSSLIGSVINSIAWHDWE